MKIKIKQVAPDKYIRIDCMSNVHTILAQLPKTTLVQDVTTMEIKLIHGNIIVVLLSFDDLRFFKESDLHLNSRDL